MNFDPGKLYICFGLLAGRSLFFSLAASTATAGLKLGLGGFPKRSSEEDQKRASGAKAGELDCVEIDPLQADGQVEVTSTNLTEGGE